MKCSLNDDFPRYMSPKLTLKGKEKYKHPKIMKEIRQLSKNHYLHLHLLFLKTRTLHVYSVLAVIFIIHNIEKLHLVISLL